MQKPRRGAMALMSCWMLLGLAFICFGEIYRDKNGYFEVSPPEGWVKKEFNDPRSKVSFDVPAPIPGQNKAGIFFLSHPLTQEVNVRMEAEDRVARLKQMGSPDARVTTIDFAGGKAEQIDGRMGQQNMILRGLMFSRFNRSYSISFTATRQDFATYWPAAEESLKTFRCIPPEGAETPADKEAVQKEKIRVWIDALKYPDLGRDAFDSLARAGTAAEPQLKEIEQSGTALQKERAAELLRNLQQPRP